MQDQLSPISVMLKKYGVTAKKSFGQNFLLDLNITNKIAKLSGDLKNYIVIEIGAGPGGLTRALLSQGATVIAIEKDVNCINILQEIQQHYPKNLIIVQDDALKIDYNTIWQQYHHNETQPKIKIIANLPYNIGTKLLLNWLLIEPWPPFYESLTLMFQKEVAERITAKCNDKNYGRLSILANWRCETKILYNLPAKAFTPPPKIDSAIVKLTPRKQPLACDKNKLSIITQYAFSQKRKMLRHSLKSMHAEQLLKKANIPGELRPQELQIQDYILLANLI